MNKPDIYTFIDSDIDESMQVISSDIVIQYCRNNCRLARVRDEDVSLVSQLGVILTPKSTYISSYINKLCDNDPDKSIIPFYQNNYHQLKSEEASWDKKDIIKNGFKIVKLV